MIKIFKFKLELLVVRFKIKGFLNIASLVVVLVGIVAGLKVLQNFLGHYEQLSILLGLFIYIFFCKYIFVSDFDKKWKEMKIFFVGFKELDIKKYYLYKNLVIFWLMVLVVLWPTNLIDMGLFILYATVLNFLLFIQILCKNKLAANEYTTTNLIIRIILCVVLIIYLKNYQLIKINKIVNGYMVLLCIIFVLFFAIQNLKLIMVTEYRHNITLFVNATKRIPFVYNNSDFLFAIRRNLLIEPLLIIICGNIVINLNLDNLYGSFFSLVVSYLCAYITIYRLLVKNEELKIIYFFNIKNIKKIKIIKVKNTVILSLFLFVVTLIPLAFVIPIKLIALGYLVSIIIFLCTSLILKIEAEKSFNRKRLIRDRDVMALTIIQAIIVLIICNVLPFNN